MPSALRPAVFQPGELRRLGLFGAAVAALHVLGFGLLLIWGLRHPAFLGVGGLAYTFGLRHAFDADHISAIDNTTRKLLAEGRRPLGVGFFFSLGHSTVVFVITLLLGIAVRGLVSGVVSQDGRLRSVGGLVGTGVSGFFLLAIGLVNLAVLVGIVRVWRAMRRGEYDADTLEHDLVAAGLMTRVLGRLFRLIRQSWQMYPIGFLFGLGFDTASEVALLAIAAGSAAGGLPIFAVLSLPLIFAAGMSMMDTADGAFMAKAYGWAFSNPVRKVFYNMTVTGLSVFVALLVGLVEVVQIATQLLHLQGPVFTFVGGLDFGVLGLVIVAAFVLTWAVALLVFRLRRVEERWTEMVTPTSRVA